jgi:two-component system, NtrC family, sensor kinase
MLEFQYSARRLYWYSATFLTAGLSVVLWFNQETILAMAALGITFVSLFSNRALMRQVEQAIEQKRHLDQQLIQSQKLAAIGELSSGIAHEINNPLAIIGQETEWIKHLLKKDSLPSPEADQELRGSVQEIVRQVDRCKEITHKLLDFARKKDPLLQKADVNKLIEDMARLVEREASQKNIRIVRNYQKDLPRVQTDPPLLRQVVLNLLNNAAHAIEKDGTITISTQQSVNHSVELIFVDTGCGVSKEYLDKIFDPFFTTKPTGKGTGLGLSISHGIITKLGGRITVVSEVGKGATFTIQLPAKPLKGEQ